MSPQIKFFILLGAMLPLFGVAEGAVDSKGSYVMCRSRKVVRTIRVTDADEGCSTIYTKLGVDKIVGQARYRNSCVDILKNIQGNLEKADWKCRDISSAKVTEIKP